MDNHLPLWMQALAATLLVIGGLFTLIGAIGLLRFKDFYMRLHAPTLATTFGVGGVLLASVVMGWAQGEIGLPALLITGFLFTTAPVSAKLLAQAALHLGLPSMRCVGYRQTWAALDGEPGSNLLQSGIAATRQLAKRQLTWLRSMPDRHIVPCDNDQALELGLAALRAAAA